MKIEKIAELCYEACRSVDRAVDGKDTKNEWLYAPNDHRNRVRSGVATFIDNPDITPEELHDAWTEEMKSDGWTHGETRDETKKEHPSMVPFNQLPMGEQVKDYIFIYLVRACTKAK
jgi:hypothetical protein